MKAFIPILFCLAILAGSTESCKHPTEPSHQCDTCSHPCDTRDTTHQPSAGDSSSHNFSWSTYHLPTNQVQEGDVSGCWVFSSSNVYAVNWCLYQFDGSAFIKKFLWNSEGGELTDIMGAKIFAFDTTDFWITLADGVWHVDGRRYEDQLVAWMTRLNMTAAPGAVNAAWGTSSKDMFFVGNNGYISHFDGTTWIQYPKVTDQKLFSVWGASHNDVWACGLDQTLGTTALLHFDGNEWSIDSLSNIPPPISGSFTGVWACDSANHQTAIVVGSKAYRTTDHGPWRLDNLSHLNDTYIGTSVTGNTANDLMLWGSWGLTMHWNGKSWHRFDELFDEGAADFTPHAAHMHGNTACIAGRKNGTSWIAIGHR